MQTLLIEFDDQKALQLLQELEGLHIIRIIRERTTETKTKLSDKYKNVFTKEDAESFIKHSHTMRREWDNI